MTTILATLATAVLVGFIATLVIADHRRERRHRARVAQIAADTWARHRRQEAANDIARHVTAAFIAATGPIHQTRADLAALETTEDRNVQG